MVVVMPELIHPDDCTGLNYLLDKGAIAVKSDSGKTNVTQKVDDLKSGKELFILFNKDEELSPDSITDLVLIKYCIDCGKKLVD